MEWFEKVIRDRAHQIDRSLPAMRGPLTTFAMLLSLIITWHAVHWGARLIVTNFGIVGGILACGLFFVISCVMDRYGL
jgi:hypothetical protein